MMQYSPDHSHYVYAGGVIVDDGRLGKLVHAGVPNCMIQFGADGPFEAIHRRRIVEHLTEDEFWNLYGATIRNDEVIL